LNGAGVFTSSGGYYGGLQATSARIIGIGGNANSYYNCSGDVLFGEFPQTNVFGILDQNSAAGNITMSGCRLSLSSTDGASSWMFDLAGGAGTQLTLYGNAITNTGANNGNFLLSTGNTVIDACGNTFANGTVADSLAGTAAISNCGSEPSYSGRCLLASAASPLACGTSSNGKVAIPVNLASYTINTKAVQTGSAITITPTTDNTGIPGAPACTDAITTVPNISASSANTSFTIAETAQAAAITCFEWSIR
jgi:hypothetical protein